MSYNMSDDFTKRIFSIIIQKAAQAIGFTSISKTALDILVDVSIENLKSLARTAAGITTHCGRTDTNGYDVFMALDAFNETSDKLIEFLNSEIIISHLRFPVQPYPFSSTPMFYSAQECNDAIVLPFRSNTDFFMEKKIESIPSFFPPFPKSEAKSQRDEMTENNDNEVGGVNEETINNALERSIEQDKPHSVNFDCELMRMVLDRAIDKDD